MEKMSGILQIGALIIGAVLLLFFIAAMFWDAPAALLGCWFATSGKTETLKFLSLGIGGAIAAYGLGALDKRANAQVTINKLTEEGLFQERLKAAVEHLSSGEESGRIASFYEFFHLAKSRRDYAQSILDILCAHLRQITNDKDKKDSQEFRALTGGLLFRKETMGPFLGLFYNLQGLDLSNVNFYTMYMPTGDINFRFANFWQANFYGVKLQNANLPGANLRNAIFSEADLLNANLKGADVTTVRFDKANLSGADLQETNLGSANLRGAIYNDKTIFPPGFDPAAAGMILQSESE